MDSVIGDVRDFELLKEVFERVQPQIVIHLAAQPIVRESYKNPRETYETNVMGTVNILECARQFSCVRSDIFNARAAVPGAEQGDGTADLRRGGLPL